jgi:AcrR family transcriptional regulator
MFNEQGLHRVGVRDIARALGLSPGNLAYHFPTRDDLVSALVMELHELNARTAFAQFPDDFSLVTLYETALAVMRNIMTYRFVLLSYVDAVMASPELRKMEEALAVRRRARHDDMIRRLVARGYVSRRAYTPRAEYLYEQGQLISSGWLAAAALQPHRRTEEEIVRHYAKLGCALLDPVLTPKGALQLRRILCGRYDASAVSTSRGA